MYEMKSYYCEICWWRFGFDIIW